MKVFDPAFSGEVESRLASVADDAEPQWGRMNRGQLIGHLNNVIQYTLGERPEMPFKGNFKTRYVFRPIVMYGLKEIPHNVPVPNIKGITREQMFPELPLETLVASMNLYHEKFAAGTLPSRTHPYFGVLSPAGWRRFHRLHFIHHLKQFAVGDGL